MFKPYGEIICRAGRNLGIATPIESNDDFWQRVDDIIKPTIYEAQQEMATEILHYQI